MKKILLLTLVVMVSFFCLTSAASAYDYSKLIPENCGIIIKVNFKPIFNSSFYNFMNVGAIKKVQDEIKAEFEKRTGLVFDRDINEAGAFVSSKMDEKTGKPENALVFLNGKLDSEKIIAEISKEKSLPFSITKEGNTQLLVSKDDEVAAAFLDKEMFVFGTKNTVINLINGKLKNGEIKKELKDDFDKATCFAYVECSDQIRGLLAGGPLANAPATAKDFITKLNYVSIFDKTPGLSVKINFSDKAKCEELKALFENGKKFAEGAMGIEETQLNERMKTVSAFELLTSDISGKKTAIAIGRELLNSIEYKTEESTSAFNLTVPEHYRTFLKPELLPIITVVGGVMAAVAVPNFKRARTQAKGKACISNMKTLEGATELYMMENTTIPEGFGPALLKTGGYLKVEPKCPEGGVYTINVGKDKNPTEIFCSKHGKLAY
ncbi:MAG: hypothetical protein QMC67_12180 [Candidatus Wallbacteria bacterium]